MSMGQGSGPMQRRILRPPPGAAPPPGGPAGPQPAVPGQTPGGPPQGGMPGGVPPSPQVGGLPPGGPQVGAQAPMPTPVGDIRGGAMEQYRTALMRRMQGAIPTAPGASQNSMMQGQTPQDPTAALGQGGGMGEGGVPGQLGAPPGQVDGGDIGSIIKQLMATRLSRRVLGRGPGQ